jgi:hypothetical protein
VPPAYLLIGAALIGLAFFLWRNRSRLHAGISSVLLAILDAVLVSYVVYLILTTIFDFSAYHTWSGAARVLFFTSKPDGVQYFAIFVGIFIGYFRLFQHETSGRLETKREYRGGRSVWCHRSALIVANSLLARRADVAKLRRPQHLLPDETYGQPDNVGDLDTIVPLQDIESNKALVPYVPAPGEYQTAHWGMLRIPYEMTTHHFLVVGATGAGKTVLIHSLMNSVLPRIKTDKSFRAFIYDDKPDFMPFARHLGLEKYVWNFDPFDANGVAWDIAADVTTTAEAMQVASVLAPVDENVSDKFWQQATQQFLGAVLENFSKENGRKWTLRDVMLAFSSETRLRKILSRNAGTERRARFFLGAHSLDDVLAVLQSKLGPYDVTASLYSHAKEKRSVREWANTNAILLVTGRSAFSEASRPINQALFRMVSLLLLNRTDRSPKEREDAKSQSNWIFLDEVREIGKLKGYHELANKGRSKGVRLVLGFQSIEGMKAEHGEHAANEITNLCAHRTFIHTTCVQTRNWEAEQLGNTVLDETVFTFSQTVGNNSSWSSGVSWQTKRETRKAMEPADFDQNLKLVTPEDGFNALNFIPYIGTYVSWVPWSWILTHVPEPKLEYYTEELRPGDHQDTLDWQPNDLDRLELPPTILVDEPPEEEGEKQEEPSGRTKKPGPKNSKKNKHEVGQTSRKDLNKDLR